MKPSDRLEKIGLTLPAITAPVGSYVPAIRQGNLIHTSGQLPMVDGKLQHPGKVPTDVSVDTASECAAIAALNALAAAADTAGGIDAIIRIVRVAVFVNATPDFEQQPKVANGASDRLVDIFGEAGCHVRAAVGANSLPLNACVEVELTVEA